ncbi:MarR family transcriptional regulator [Rhodococcus wratislaviensis IFP 2016]|uniref:MarR family transcriptional regulator n=1 Tax=Rhodococcus opacus M213 TaxID=1129896 RepID=K8X4K0_RHOOP|nr:MarR family winged helix-turn-helix transcriptional regulator [Rhodococcus opacus]EKT76383.1 MarR family transcriptional regulator [Rhodococcus opacus M213]ELB92668.1 MarR family transcriptional regulator [Rhodococcus wratislaviensis IFP 2016]
MVGSGGAVVVTASAVVVSSLESPLWSHPEQEMPQLELTDGLSWSASRASHMLHRLELRGFVHRVHSGYGRARVVQLTPGGSAHLMKAFDAHGRAFRTMLLDRLTERQRTTLLKVMTGT